MTDHQTYEVTRVSDGEVFFDLADRQRALDLAQTFATSEGVAFDVVLKLVATRRTKLTRVMPLARG